MAAGDIILTGTISTSADSDVYPTHKAELCLGGYRSVADIAARDAIPAQRREEGMAVYVVADGKKYILKGGTDNTKWVEDAGGGGGSGDSLELTEEHIIGYLNGKPVYRKIFSATSGAKINTYAGIAPEESFADKLLISLGGILTDTDGAQNIVPSHAASATTFNIWIGISSSTKKISEYHNYAGYNSCPMTITAIYTKTTD